MVCYRTVTSEQLFAQTCTVLTATLADVAGAGGRNPGSSPTHRAVQSKAARALLRDAVQDRKDLQGAVLSDPQDGPLTYESGAVRVWASISHRGNFVGAAVSDAGPVGMDLEIIQYRANWSEMAEVAWPRGPRPRDLTAFYIYWTLWEACVKCHAQDIFADIADQCLGLGRAGWVSAQVAEFNYAFRVDGQMVLAVVQHSD